MVSDELWQVIKLLLPSEKKAIERRVSTDLETGIVEWGLFRTQDRHIMEILPGKLDSDSWMTGWRWPLDWQKAGVFNTMHRAVLDD